MFGTATRAAGGNASAAWSNVDVDETTAPAVNSSASCGPTNANSNPSTHVGFSRPHSHSERPHLRLPQPQTSIGWTHLGFSSAATAPNSNAVSFTVPACGFRSNAFVSGRNAPAAHCSPARSSISSLFLVRSTDGLHNQRILKEITLCVSRF